MLIKNINYKVSNFHLNINEIKLSNEMNLLFGESGSGKSTLVDILVGFKQSIGYSWTINGVDLAKLSLKEKKIGLVLQGGEVFPHLTGLQCLKFASESRNIPSTQFDNDLNFFLDSLNLSKKIIKQKTPTLSGGERQRLALICALIGDPSVLLLDEPFSALDKANVDSAIRLVTDFCRERNVPVLLISHEENLRSKISNQFQLCNGGIVT